MAAFGRYPDALRIKERFPALMNANFNQYIATGDAVRYGRQIREAEHLPGFTVFPKTTAFSHRLIVRLNSSPEAGSLGRKRV